MRITKEDFTIDIEHQSIEIPNSGGVRQSTLAPLGVAVENVFKDVKTVVDVLRRGHKLSNNGPCLGWRDSNPYYRWLSYQEVIERAKNISYGLVHAGMKKGQDSFVGIYSQNCVEWVLAEHACFFQSAVPVPLYDTLGPTACAFILNNVEAEFMVCDKEKKARDILDSKEDIPKLQHIVMIEEASKDLKVLAAKKGVTIHQLRDIEESGRQKNDTLLLPSSSDLATVCFTSGTTGNPKGVVLTHGNVVAMGGAFCSHIGIDYVSAEDRFLSYLPTAHVFDRICHVILFINGGSVGFFRGDIKLLLEDISALKPTLFGAVPRVFNKIFDSVQNKVKSHHMKKWLLDAAIKVKQAELERGIIRNNSIWDRLILKNIRNVLGGEVKLMLSAGAPIRKEILSFFKCCMGCPVLEAYGQTEVTAASNCSVIGDHKGGTVGPPFPCCHVKLVDVPDMGYFARNDEGEVAVKGPIIMKGYFKDPVRTAEVLDEEGWLHTGDIGRWMENGALAIIDRKKNLLKLSQGEYVSPEKVEAVYLACSYVEQIVVHGDSLENCLVAIAVPDKEELMSWCSQRGIFGEWNEICGNEVVKANVLKELYELGKNAGLKGFEQVKAIYLHPDGFSLQNGILTATLKVKREECRRQFKDIIFKMYEDIRRSAC